MFRGNILYLPLSIYRHAGAWSHPSGATQGEAKCAGGTAVVWAAPDGRNTRPQEEMDAGRAGTDVLGASEREGPTVSGSREWYTDDVHVHVGPRLGWQALSYP